MAEQLAASAGGNVAVDDLDPPDAAFAQSISDGSFAALLEDLFAPQGGNEGEQMILFKEVLRALIGFPLAEESSIDMALT
jgi:hypothetical protein